MQPPDDTANPKTASKSLAVAELAFHKTKQKTSKAIVANLAFHIHIKDKGCPLLCEAAISFIDCRIHHTTAIASYDRHSIMHNVLFLYTELLIWKDAGIAHLTLRNCSNNTSLCLQ